MPRSGPNQKLQHFSYFSQETDSATNLLAYGLTAMQRSPFNATTLDPVLTTLSIGAEKLLKLSLGFISIEETGHWLTLDQMKAYKHDISKLDNEVRDKLRARSGLAKYPQRVTAAIDSVERDQVWILLSEAFTQYGKSGRFYYLDALAGKKLDNGDPASTWKQVEAAAMKRDPKLLTMSATASRGRTDWDSFRSALNTSVASSVVGWRAMISEAATLGAFGAARYSWGRAIVSPGRQE